MTPQTIPLHQIYCKHWLMPSGRHKDYITECKYPVYETPPHLALDLRDSIHYHSLRSENYEEYNELITTTKQKEHTKLGFQLLNLNFDPEIMPRIRVKWDRSINRYVILDGVHRASILLHKGIVTDSFPARFLEIV